MLGAAGAQGAFEAGAVRRYCEDFNFVPDIICGASVGSINAAKLAEAPLKGIKDEQERLRVFLDKCDELVGFWDDLANGTFRVWDRNRVLDESKDYLNRRIDLGDLIDMLFKREAALADETRATSQKLHSIHWMGPLRDALRKRIDPKDSNVLASNCAWRRQTYNQGRPSTLRSLTPTGRVSSAYAVELETTGFDGRANPMPTEIDGHPVVVRILEAVYASATIPVLMDPTLADYSRPEVLRHRNSRYAKVAMRSPLDLKFLVASNEDRWAFTPKRPDTRR